MLFFGCYFSVLLVHKNPKTWGLLDLFSIFGISVSQEETRMLEMERVLTVTCPPASCPLGFPPERQPL